jgi:hypothetical protein
VSLGKICRKEILTQAPLFFSCASIEFASTGAALTYERQHEAESSESHNLGEKTILTRAVEIRNMGDHLLPSYTYGSILGCEPTTKARLTWVVT